MKMLIDIMRTTQGWSCAWWLNPMTDRILSNAARLGQVHWTERGASLARKYLEQTSASA